MSGFDVRLPRRLLVDEVITTGTGQKTGVTGWTGQGVGPRYNSWAAPMATSSSVGAGTVMVLIAGTTSGPTVTAFSSSAGAGGLGQPDYPRTVKVFPSTSAFNAANSSAAVTVNGTNQFGVTVADVISLGNGPGPVDGTVAFKTITSIVIPAASSAGTPFTINLGNTFGLDRTPLSAAAVIQGVVNGTRESTFPVIGAPSTSGNVSPAAALPASSKATAKFSTAATSSAGALVEITFFAQDTTHI